MKKCSFAVAGTTHKCLLQCLRLEVDRETLIKLTGSLTCYCGNKSGSYRNELLVTSGAVCFNNRTPSWWGLISVPYAVFYQHQLSCQELLRGCCCISWKGKQLLKGENRIFKSLLLAEAPRAAFQWDFDFRGLLWRPFTGCTALGSCNSTTTVASWGQSRTPASGGPIHPRTDPWHHYCFTYRSNRLQCMCLCTLLVLTRTCCCVLSLQVKLLIALCNTDNISDWAVAQDTAG